MGSVRLDDEGNIRLLDENTFHHAHNLKTGLDAFISDLTAFAAACENTHISASSISKSLLSLKASAALKRADLNKEISRREDSTKALHEQFQYETDQLRYDRAYLHSLKAMEERVVNIQDNLFLR